MVVSAELPSISIAQFAGIRAALAEGFELEEVLAQEGVPSWRWPDLETELTLAVVDDEETMNRFIAHTAEAEDHLARPVAPLDEDLEAWAGFVAGLSANPRLGEELGLRPTDFGRLQRGWARRFEQQPELAKRASKLQAEAPPPPEAVAAGEVELTPFSWSPTRQEAEAQHQLEPVAFLAETAPLKSSLKKGSAVAPLPFAGVRPPPPGTLEIEPVAEMGQTAPLSRKPRVAATPFEPPPPASEPTPASKPRVAPRGGQPLVPPTLPRSTPVEQASLGEELEPRPELAGTRSAVPAPTGPALPFQGKREAPGPIADELEPVAEMGQTAPLEPKDALGGTVMMDPPADPLAGTVMMDAPPASPATWAPEDYGRFLAALDAGGADRAAVLRRWGVRSERQCDHLERMWRMRIEADESVAERVAKGKGGA